MRLVENICNDYPLITSQSHLASVELVEPACLHTLSRGVQALIDELVKKLELPAKRDRRHFIDEYRPVFKEAEEREEAELERLKVELEDKAALESLRTQLNVEEPDTKSEELLPVRDVDSELEELKEKLAWRKEQERISREGSTFVNKEAFNKARSPSNEGWVYIIRSTHLRSHVKIGLTKRGNPSIRMEELDNPQVLGLQKVSDPAGVVKALHAQYADYRLPQSEYFQLEQHQIDEALHTLNSLSND